MRGPAGRGEGAPPSALTLPPPPKPEGTPFPLRGGSKRRGRRGCLAGGERPPGTRSVGGKERGAVPAGGVARPAPAESVPADPRGPSRRRPGREMRGAQGCWVTLPKEGARMRASVHCMSVERVFLLCSLCALPLAASDSCSGSEFYKNLVETVVGCLLHFYMMLWDELGLRIR